MKQLNVFKNANIILIRKFLMKFHWQNFAVFRFSLISIHRTETLNYVQLFFVQSADITVEAKS